MFTRGYHLFWDFPCLIFHPPRSQICKRSSAPNIAPSRCRSSSLRSWGCGQKTWDSHGRYGDTIKSKARFFCMQYHALGTCQGKIRVLKPGSSRDFSRKTTIGHTEKNLSNAWISCTYPYRYQDQTGVHSGERVTICNITNWTRIEP